MAEEEVIQLPIRKRKFTPEEELNNNNKIRTQALISIKSNKNKSRIIDDEEDDEEDDSFGIKYKIINLFKIIIIMIILLAIRNIAPSCARSKRTIKETFEGYIL